MASNKVALKHKDTGARYDVPESLVAAAEKNGFVRVDQAVAKEEPGYHNEPQEENEPANQDEARFEDEGGVSSSRYFSSSYNPYNE